MLNTRTIAVPGGPRMQLFTAGSGAPLVWLHGITGVSPSDPILDELAKRFAIYAPTMPGRADLAELTDIDDIRDLALHYDTMLETLELDRIVLVGHSFGGMLAAEIAALAPKRVAKLVLISPLGLWNEAYPVTDLFTRPYSLMDELLWQGAIIRPKTSDVTAHDSDIERAVSIVNGAACVAKFVWPIADKGLRKRLHRISAPTLVVFGEQDAYVPVRYADDFVAAICGAQKVVMRGSHMLPYEKPTKIAAEITRR